jgi:hypothetical protein
MNSQRRTMQSFTHETTKVKLNQLKLKLKQKRKNRSREENWERCEISEVMRDFYRIF